MFLHQAVMEALVGGDTEIVPHDLRITMNKLTRIHKASKKTGYAREFKVTCNYHFVHGDSLIYRTGEAVFHLLLMNFELIRNVVNHLLECLMYHLRRN